METYKDKLGKVAVTVDKDYWSIDKEYDKLVIVERQCTGTTFISRKPVPKGTSILNREYWIKFSKWADIPYEIVQEFGDGEEVTISQKVISEKFDYIQDQIDKLHPGTIGIVMYASPTIVYDDSESNVTIKAKKADNTICDSIEIIIDDNVIAKEDNVSELETTVIINKTTKINAEAIQSGFSYEGYINITGVKPYYVGSGNNYTEITNDAHKQNIKTSPYGTYNINVASSQSYIFFVVPFSMTINRATMSGFDFPIQSPENVIIEGNSYKVYKSSNTYDSGLLTIVIS